MCSRVACPSPQLLCTCVCSVSALLCPCLCFCVYVCVSVFLCLCLCVCVSVFMSVLQYLCLCVCVPVSMSVCLSSVCGCACAFVCIYACVGVRACVYEGVIIGHILYVPLFVSGALSSHTCVLHRRCCCDRSWVVSRACMPSRAIRATDDCSGAGTFYSIDALSSAHHGRQATESNPTLRSHPAGLLQFVSNAKPGIVPPGVCALHVHLLMVSYTEICTHRIVYVYTRYIAYTCVAHTYAHIAPYRYMRTHYTACMHIILYVHMHVILHTPMYALFCTHASKTYTHLLHHMCKTHTCACTRLHT